MDRLILLLHLLFAASAIPAQTGAFLYLQSENNLPYTVTYEGATFHSSATGYLVISQLPAGAHTLSIDFGPAIAPVHLFRLLIQDKPVGYSIRQSVSNELQLFDLVGNTLLKGDVVRVQKIPREPEQLILPKTENTEPAKQPAITVVEKPRKQAAPAEPAVIVAKPVLHWENPVSAIRKIFDREGADGIDQVYVLTGKSRSDTIAIFVPALREPKPAQLAMARSGVALGIRNRSVHR